MRILIAVLLLCLFSINAHAKTRHVEPQPFDRHAIHSGGSEIGSRMFIVPKVRTAGLKTKRKHHQKRYRDKPVIPKNYAARTRVAAQIADHPIGCPRTRFCGCGTALYLLGKRVTQGGLAIAKNWLSFPRVACAANMAAARPGHVFAIIECLSGNRALAYDPNSGGHRTRIHVRDLSRYAIVNPHVGSRYAQAP